jgi:hypothetical protein
VDRKKHAAAGAERSLRRKVKNKEDHHKRPPAVSVQLARLFGTESRIATRDLRTPAEWRATLRKVVREVGRYLDANVESDEVHMMMLYSGLAAAEESLKEDDFWPAYVEGITRLALTLMGDCPDHRKRKWGAKRKEHYRLRRMRSVRYCQDELQRVRTLLTTSAVGFPKLSINPRDALGEFRELYGPRGTYIEFFRWYRKTYPEDYVAVF